eukprot:TRINITY_DN30429_c0_g1_i3.p1 TRINITY_DN30429_c0_g1~~TRINITY_DN30429_c0_g1_i3.p1  ORF type:complete len:131 (+),score=12.95 TRINITY_DN30429_c0_g1_i3:184-576(+)
MYTCSLQATAETRGSGLSLLVKRSNRHRQPHEQPSFKPVMSKEVMRASTFEFKADQHNSVPVSDGLALLLDGHSCIPPQIRHLGSNMAGSVATAGSVTSEIIGHLDPLDLPAVVRNGPAWKLHVRRKLMG